MSEHPVQPMPTTPSTQRQREGFHSLLSWSYVDYGRGHGKITGKLICPICVCVQLATYFFYLCDFFFAFFFILCRQNAKLSCKKFYLERVGFLYRRKQKFNCQDDKKTQYFKNPTTFFLVGNIKYCEASEWHQLHSSLVTKKDQIRVFVWNASVTRHRYSLNERLSHMGFPARSKSYLSQTSGESAYVHACVLVHIFVDVNVSCLCSWTNTVSDTARIIKYCLSLLSGYRPVCVRWVKPKGPSVGTSPHAPTHTHTFTHTFH